MGAGLRVVEGAPENGLEQSMQIVGGVETNRDVAFRVPLQLYTHVGLQVSTESFGDTS